MRSKRHLILAVILSLCGFLLSVSLTLPAVNAARPASLTDDEMRERILANERAGMEALKAGDVGAFARLLAEDAIFIDDHGSATKAQVVNNVAGFKLLDYTMGDVKFVRIADTAGLIGYTLNEHGNSHGHEFTVTVYVSTVCAERAGKWLSVFSQETLAKPAAKPAAAPTS